MPGYRTPKGVAEQLSDIPGRDDYKTMNWKGASIIVGPGRSPFFFRRIATRMANNESNIFIVAGPPGSGKTYFALRVAQILDPKFDVSVQTVFRREQLLRLLGDNTPIKRRQVIIIDESQYTMGSRRWYEDVQKDLMDSLEAVRSKGYCIIICALHLQLLDVIIRKFVLSHMIYMIKRGTGIAYSLFTPRFEKDMHKRRLGPVTVALPDVSKCSHPDCLECKYGDKCMTVRAVYERLKLQFVNERNKMAERKIIEREKQKTMPSNTKLMEMLMEHTDMFTYTNRGSIDKFSLKFILEEKADLVISKDRGGILAKMIGFKHPELEKKPEK